MSGISTCCWIGAAVAALSGAFPVAVALATVGLVTAGDGAANARELESDAAAENAEALRQASQSDNQALSKLARQYRRDGDRGIAIERTIEETGPCGKRNRVVDRQTYYFDDE